MKTTLFLQIIKENLNFNQNILEKQINKVRLPAKCVFLFALLFISHLKKKMTSLKPNFFFFFRKVFIPYSIGNLI